MKIPRLPSLLTVLALTALAVGTPLAAQSSSFAVNPAPALPREQLLATLNSYFNSGGPTEADIVPSDMQVLSRKELDDHFRWHISYKVEKDDTAYAYVLFPKPIPTREKPAPLVLAMHATTGWGKSLTAGVLEDLPPSRIKARGMAWHKQRMYGLHLVRMGFIAFVPDMAGYGERIYLDAPTDTYNQKHVAHFKELWSQKWPGWRFPHAKQLWDIQRALDMIEAWPFVQQENIGAIGHSLGAWATTYVMPMDERIKAGVINSGGGLHFQRKLWEEQAALLRFMDSPQQHNLHSLMNVMIMATAPRAVLYIKPWNDSAQYERAWQNHLEGYRIITEYYRQLLEAEGKDGSKPQFDIYYHMEKHSFPPEAHALAYAWLKRQLMPQSDQ